MAEALAGIVRVLEALERAGAAGPGDLVAATGLPRYRVLATVRCLEELGLVEPIYSKGSYKVYRLSVAGARLLEEVRAGASLRDVIASALEAPAPAGAAPAAPVAVGEGRAEAEA